MLRLLVLLVGLMACGRSVAQVPDTTTAPDTTVVEDTLEVPPPPPARAERPPPPDSVIGFFRDVRGRPIQDVRPEHSPALHPSEWLMEVPLSFTHAFRTPGWPDAWSPFGLAPESVLLYRGGYPHVNLTTGRSMLEMIPFGLMDPLRLAPGSGGGAASLVSDVRTFDQARPLTGLRYQSDNMGLQHVEAFHAQRRLATILGRRGQLNLSAAYMGRGASGEYPGSSLQRERSLFGRVRFARPMWSIQISNLYGRHDVGAHGGVIPWSGGGYETIYARTDAVVRQNGARRLTIRNDLDVTLRALLGGRTLDVVAYRTWESFRYTFQQERLPARIVRTGALAGQTFGFGGHLLRVEGRGWVEEVVDDSAFTALPGLNRYAASLSVRDSFRVGPASVTASAGFRTTDAGAAPIGHLRVSRQGMLISAFVEAQAAMVDPPRIAQQGFGTHVATVGDARSWRANTATGGIAFTPGALRVEARAFLAGERNRLSAVLDEEDVLSFITMPSSIDRAGLAVRLAVRADAERGLYADLRANHLVWTSKPAIAGAAPLRSAQPDLWGSARLGARMLLFQGDLDADLYVRGHAWNGMRGRHLHAPTGLTALPPPDAMLFEANGFLDVVLEAQVREATIFVGYENVLSGTQIALGNLLVPDYPLPERRFRLGVYWPIQD